MKIESNVRGSSKLSFEAFLLNLLVLLCDLIILLSNVVGHGEAFELRAPVIHPVTLHSACRLAATDDSL